MRVKGLRPHDTITYYFALLTVYFRRKHQEDTSPGNEENKQLVFIYEECFQKTNFLNSFIHYNKNFSFHAEAVVHIDFAF